MRAFRQRSFWLILVFGGLVVWSTLQPVLAIPQPTPSFYVRDDEGLLSPETEETIVRISVELAKQTKAQVVVLTTPGFDGMDSSEYALSVLRDWGIGDSTLNNGVLILLSLGEGISRIEVGYGLEGALPDSVLGRIQDDYMLPYYNDGDFDKGMINGYMAVVERIANEYNITLDTTAPVVYGTQPETLFGWPEWVWIVIIVGIVLILDLRFLNGNLLSLVFRLAFSGGGRSGGFGGFGGSGGGGGASRRF